MKSEDKNLSKKIHKKIISNAMNQINITKRDGTIVAYNPDKVVNAIMSAFTASKEGNLAHAQEIAKSLQVKDGMSVEEIQNQVEY